ncbi:MAG: hypothetical protein GC191_17745 [Azospirillum sp.]|nr:hypothetical protein [Azospirillum sp.]
MASKPDHLAPTAAGPWHWRSVDLITLAGHPDAKIDQELLLVVVLLVFLGGFGLVPPLLNLRVFQPDQSFVELFLRLGRIAVSTLALVAAGLALGRFKPFTAVYIAVLLGVVNLAALSITLSLIRPHQIGDAGFGLFELLGLALLASLPVILASRKRRMIFDRKLSADEVEALAALQESINFPVIPPLDSWAKGAAAPEAPTQRRSAKLDRPLSDLVLRKARRSPRRRGKAAGETGSADQMTLPPGPAAEHSGAMAVGSHRIGLEALVNLKSPKE